MNTKKRREQDGPSAVPDSIDQQLAIVHRSNAARVEDLEQRTQSIGGKLEELLDEADDVLNAGATPSVEGRALVVVPTEKPGFASSDRRYSWTDTLSDAALQLSSRGIDAPGSVVELLSEVENKEIVAYLDRPLYRRIAWDKWDLLWAFGVGLVGAAIDLLLGTPKHFVQGAMQNKDHWLGAWMERIHKTHPAGAPIDFQGQIDGQSFTGKFGFHRGLSSGHDLLRPVEGIAQFKDGVFRDFFWKDGIKHVVESPVNENGVSYAPIGWAAAVFAWLCHMACDVFSSTSLPIPGTSWLRELPSHDVRSFVQNSLYQKGINLRHVTLQTIAPLAVEIGNRSYVAIRYKGSDAPEDALKQKTRELLAVSHTLTVAINVGKIVILKNPLLLNVPALLALLRSVLGLVILEQKRNSFIHKASRNVTELRDSQDDIENMLDARIPAPLLVS